MSSMFAPESCRNQPIRFLQRSWFNIIVLLLGFVFISSVLSYETHAQEATPGPSSDVSETQPSVNNNPTEPSENAAAKRPVTTNNDTDAAKDPDKKAPSADDSEDEEKTHDPAEILSEIRKNFAKKNGLDKKNDDLILSQSSAFIFLNRKKIRDVTESILDHWCLSSFEDDFNLTRIEFEAVVVPLVIDLDSDFDARLSLRNNDNPMLKNSEVEIALSKFTNFHIPESVMEFIKENLDNDEIASEDPSVYLPETFSNSSYMVLFLALLGFSILGYVIYRIIVWLFLLDQNKDFNLDDRKEEDVVAPVDMDAFSAYYFQKPSEDKR